MGLKVEMLRCVHAGSGNFFSTFDDTVLDRTIGYLGPSPANAHVRSLAHNRGGLR